MKNIFIIPTDQPSKLWINTITGKLVLDKEPNTLHSHHLYITSNEEIREGDWFLSDFNSFPLHNIKELSERKDSLGWKQEDLKNNLKIILTTDQLLIADGVQAIDDEFLKWFVKNPSCESVTTYDGLLGEPRIWKKYIIIPKEKPKQETLEDVAERMSIGIREEDYKDGFIDGAKYMAERMYSEKDLRESFHVGRLYQGREADTTFNEWFEQFKKK